MFKKKIPFCVRNDKIKNKKNNKKMLLYVAVMGSHPTR